MVAGDTPATRRRRSEAETRPGPGPNGQSVPPETVCQGVRVICVRFRHLRPGPSAMTAVAAQIARFRGLRNATGQVARPVVVDQASKWAGLVSVGVVAMLDIAARAAQWAWDPVAIAPVRGNRPTCSAREAKRPFWPRSERCCRIWNKTVAGRTPGARSDRGGSSLGRNGRWRGASRRGTWKIRTAARDFPPDVRNGRTTWKPAEPIRIFHKTSGSMTAERAAWSREFAEPG
jgi:hypothetical protein